MKNICYIVIFLSLYANNISSQSKSLLEYIPTKVLYTITFNGKNITYKSEGIEKNKFKTNVITNFEQLISKYKQSILDENTSVTEQEIKDIEKTLENSHKKDSITFNNKKYAVESPQKNVYNKYEIYNYKENNIEDKINLETILIPIINNGINYGLNTNENYYIFGENNDSLSYSAIVLKKNDETKFNNFIDKIIPNSKQEKLIIKTNNYKYHIIKDNNLIIVWNKYTVSFIDYNIVNSYYNHNKNSKENYYESYTEKLELEKLEEQTKEKKAIENIINKLYNSNPQQSIKYNNNYKKSIIESGDISLFVNAVNINYLNLSLKSTINNNIEDFLSMINDNFTYGHINFNNNNIEFVTTQHIGNKYLKEFKKVNKNKFDKSMYKYIENEKLLAIAGISVNIEPIYNIYKDIYINALNHLTKEEQWIGTAVDIAFTFFDEEEVFELIKGNFIFALTDIREFDVEYTSYEYDEDYNRVETTKNKKETLPEFVSLISVGNEELKNKIVKLMSKRDVIAPKEHYYMLNKKSGTHNIFYMLKNDLLIITNNEKLLSTNNGEGIKKSEQVSGDILKLMKKNNMFAYWTPKATFDKIPKEFVEEIKHLENNMNSYKHLEIKGIKNKNNLFTTHTTLKLNENTDKHSLIHILDIINSIK